MPSLFTTRSVLLSLAGGIGLLAGACSAVLDFTECRDDSDCADFFTDNKPMYCSESQCKTRSKCTSNSQCAGLGEEYICSLTGACAATTNEQCAAPIYPGGKASDEVVFIGSIVDKTGADKDLGLAAEAAFVQALDDFHAGGGALRDGKQVAIIPCDSGGSVTTAEAAAKHLGNNLNVPAILGPLADDEFTRVAEKVSVINGVLAYTNSPTAAIPLDFSDSSDLIWQTNVSVNIQGRAFGTHLKHEIDADAFGTPTPKVTLLFILDDYGYAMYYALATDKKAGEINRIPEVSSQVISSYRDLEDGKAKLDGFGDTDVLIILGGAEVADLLKHYKDSGDPWPTRVYVAERSFAAVAKLGDTTLVPNLRAIGPDLETANYAKVKARIGADATRAEAGLAYDAAMVTLLGMSAHNAKEPITGLAIRSAMSRLNDTTSTPVSFGDDPSKFVKTAITEISAGKTIDVIGASGPLNYRTDGTVCGDLVAFQLADDAKSLVPADRFTATCPEGLTGAWAPAGG